VAWCPTGDMIGDFITKPLQGALFRKFRDQIMGVTPARDPVPGKTDSNVGKTETSKNKPNKCKAIRLVPPGKKAAPQECVGSQTRDRSKGTPSSWKKISDPQDLTIFNQARKKISRSPISQEGRPKSDPSFTSLLQNNLFRGTVFSLLQEYKNNKRIEITEWNPHSNIRKTCPGLDLTFQVTACGAQFQSVWLGWFGNDIRLGNILFTNGRNSVVLVF
jgi:hypothetical protein